MKHIMFWGWPTRLGHWLLAGAFAVAWLTGESESWRLVHVFAGGFMVGIISFRLIWGVITKRHGRFSGLVRSPSAVWAYLKSWWPQNQTLQQYTRHKPAGGWAIVAFLLVFLAAASGWLNYQDIGGEISEETHEVLANTLLIWLGIHVTGILFGIYQRRNQHPHATVTGFKSGTNSGAVGEVPFAKLWGAMLMLGWTVLCSWAFSP